MIFFFFSSSFLATHGQRRRKFEFRSSLKVEKFPWTKSNGSGNNEEDREVGSS
jgi:hypothetical protein